MTTEIPSLPYTCSSVGETYIQTDDLTNSSGTALTISAANVIIDAQGFSITQNATNTIGIFINAANTEIYDLDLIGPTDHSGSSSRGIYVNDDVTDTHLHDCTFDKWFDGTYFGEDSNGFLAEDLVYTNCTSHDIKAYVGDDFIFQRITCTGASYGLTAQNCTNWHFYDCEVANATEWAYINDGGGETYTIERCTSTGGNGYYTDGSATDFTIRDCSFSGGSYATRIEAASYFTLLHVTTASSGIGIWTLGGTNNFTVYGCTMTNNSVCPGYFNTCSYFDLEYNTRSGNGNSNNYIFNSCTNYTTTLDAEAEPAIATPTFDPVAGTYGSTQNVEIECTQTSASIYYTTDGSDPDETDTLYTAPVAVATSLTLKAIAMELNYPDSNIGSAAYTISGQTFTLINSMEY